MPKGLAVNVKCNALLSDLSDVKDRFSATKHNNREDKVITIITITLDQRNRLEKIIIEVKYRTTLLAGQFNSLATRFLRWCIHSRQNFAQLAGLLNQLLQAGSPQAAHCSWCNPVLQHCSPPYCQLLVVALGQGGPRLRATRVSKARTSPSHGSPTETYSLTVLSPLYLRITTAHLITIAHFAKKTLNKAKEI